MYSLYAQILSLSKIFGTAFCVRFRRLADFYSKDFSLGTLYYQIVVLILERKEEILQWISENQSKAYIAKQLSCKPETLSRYL